MKKILLATVAIFGLANTQNAEAISLPNPFAKKKAAPVTTAPAAPAAKKPGMLAGMQAGFNKAVAGAQKAVAGAMQKKPWVDAEAAKITAAATTFSGSIASADAARDAAYNKAVQTLNAFVAKFQADLTALMNNPKTQHTDVADYLVGVQPAIAALSSNPQIIQLAPELPGQLEAIRSAAYNGVVTKLQAAAGKHGLAAPAPVAAPPAVVAPAAPVIAAAPVSPAVDPTAQLAVVESPMAPTPDLPAAPEAVVALEPDQAVAPEAAAGEGEVATSEVVEEAPNTAAGA